MKGLVCLPLHIWDRELDSRLIWSYLLANNGFDVILGHEYSISSLYGSGIPLFHLGAGRPVHNNPRSTNWYPSILVDDGFVGLIYEEGINDLNHGPDHHFAGITAQSTASCSRLYGWAAAERSLCMKAAPAEQISDSIFNKYHLSCHTRFELMSPLLGSHYFSNRSSALKEVFGTYILISDNFAVETFGSNDVMDKKAQYSQFATDERLTQLLEMRRAEARNLSRLRDTFSELIFQVALSLPHIHFVLRPHPVSNPNFWHSKFHNFRNVTVICHEACDPWIFASSGVLHSGCTIGLQAVIAKIPSLDLSDLIVDNRSGLSSSVASDKPTTFDQLKKTVTQYISQDTVRPKDTLVSNLPKLSINDYLIANISQSGLPSLNMSIPDISRVPETSLSTKIIDDCREFFSTRQSFYSKPPGYINDLINSMPQLKPNPGKAKTWTIQHISAKLRNIHTIFSSRISGFNIKIYATKSPNVFLVRPDR